MLDQEMKILKPLVLCLVSKTPIWKLFLIQMKLWIMVWFKWLEVNSLWIMIKKLLISKPIVYPKIRLIFSIWWLIVLWNQDQLQLLVLDKKKILFHTIKVYNLVLVKISLTKYLKLLMVWKVLDYLWKV